MLKWYADNSELSTTKEKNNVLLFGGIIISATEEKKLKKIIEEVKEEYTSKSMPIKWNFKDLKETFYENNKSEDYDKLLSASYKWRREIIKRSVDIDYKIIIACTERYYSSKPLSVIKEELIGICFTQALTRLGMYIKQEAKENEIEIVLDWPESSNPKPFNKEYFQAYNFGISSSNVTYYSGSLNTLGFVDTLYFAKSTQSSLLQFTDLVVGACKDYILKHLHSIDNSLGYELTEIIKHKYRGYPNNIIERGMNYAPKGENYNKLKTHLKTNNSNTGV